MLRGSGTPLVCLGHPTLTLVGRVAKEELSELA